MKYDPIMCMMVDDSVKTKDGLDYPEKNAGYEMKKEGQYFKIYKNGKLIGMKSTEEEARREAARHRAANDSNTLDKAIKNCDVNKEEGFKIYNATVRNDTLYIEYEDLLYGRGKKEKESFTRTEAKKLLNDPWNTWLGTSKLVVKQFAG